MTTYTSPVRSRSDAEAIAFLGGVVAIRLTRDQTDGTVTVMENLLPRGMATPLHVHAHEHEVFYVIDGQITVWMDDEHTRATAGDLVWLPRGKAHAFHVDSDRACVLGLSVPGGYEQFFRLAGEPAAEFNLDAVGSVPPDMDRIAAAAAAAGVEILGPPPFDTNI